ncbi:hypothetical protein FV228_22325, partial [Methylobacterium sp. WL18]
MRSGKGGACAQIRNAPLTDSSFIQYRVDQQGRPSAARPRENAMTFNRRSLIGAASLALAAPAVQGAQA